LSYISDVKSKSLVHRISEKRRGKKYINHSSIVFLWSEGERST